MSRESWRERHRRAAERKRWIRLDRVQVEPLTEGRDHKVVIEGFNLHPVISPPRVTVGDVLLERLEFQRDGRAIRGVLPREPRGHHVVVDYGFVRAELKG